MKYKELYNFLEKAYFQYLESKKLDKLIYIIYNTFSKELKYYHHDQEFIDNFIIEFIEKRLKNVLNNYQKKFDSVKNNFTFSSYLLSSIKKAFYSYKEKYKNQNKWDQIHTYNIDLINFILDDENRFVNLYNSTDDFWFTILDYLNEFSLIDRIIFKLYYDFKLNLEELEYLVSQYGFEKTKSFLTMYYQKKEFANDKNNMIEQNSYKFYIENLICKHYDDINKQYKILRYNLYKKRKSSKTLPSARVIGKFLNFKNYKIYNHLFKIRKRLIHLLNLRDDFIKNTYYQCA